MTFSPEKSNCTDENSGSSSVDTWIMTYASVSRRLNALAPDSNVTPFSIYVLHVHLPASLTSLHALHAHQIGRAHV